MQDMLLDVEFISINVLHHLSLNSLGFCVVLRSWHFAVHQLVHFSHQLQHELGYNPKIRL